MWTITLRDLQYRRRQFAIAVVGAAVVFALTLILTGISEGFRKEARDIVDAVGADAWVVPEGVTGPFTSQSGFAAARAGEVEGARPLVEFRHVATLPDGEDADINVIGHDIGPLGDPDWESSEKPAPGQAVADERLGVDAGDTIAIGGRRLEVERIIDGRSYFAGVPVVYTSLTEAQEIAFGGDNTATVVVAQGSPQAVPQGFTSLDRDAVREDLLRPLDGAIGAIDRMRLLMWLVAAVIVGAVTYLSALERTRDFAVLKAVGGTARGLGAGLAAQAVLVCLLASAIAIALAHLLAGAFPLPVAITTGATVALPIVAVLIGLLASLGALRRVIRVDPALAFG